MMNLYQPVYLDIKREIRDGIGPATFDLAERLIRRGSSLEEIYWTLDGAEPAYRWME